MISIYVDQTTNHLLIQNSPNLFYNYLHKPTNIVFSTFCHHSHFLEIFFLHQMIICPKCVLPTKFLFHTLGECHTISTIWDLLGSLSMQLLQRNGHQIHFFSSTSKIFHSIETTFCTSVCTIKIQQLDSTLSHIGQTSNGSSLEILDKFVS